MLLSECDAVGKGAHAVRPYGGVGEQGMNTPKPRHLIWTLIALTLTALLVWGLMPAPLRVETAKCMGAPP